MSAVCERSQCFLDLRLGNRESSGKTIGVGGSARATKGVIDRHTHVFGIHPIRVGRRYWKALLPRRSIPIEVVNAVCAQSSVAGDAATQTTPVLPSWSAITVSDGASLSSTTVPPAATAAAIRCWATSGAT